MALIPVVGVIVALLTGVIRCHATAVSNITVCVLVRLIRVVASLIFHHPPFVSSLGRCPPPSRIVN